MNLIKILFLLAICFNLSFGSFGSFGSFVEGMINNNDDDNQEPKVSIADANITEGDSGTKHLNFTVTLDRPAPNSGVTVQVEPHNITANEGEDYIRHTSSINFVEGESSKTIYYIINGDTKVEEDETFRVELHNPQHASLDTKFEAIGTIINDDSESECDETLLSLDIPVSSTNDDAEEKESNGHMYRDSSDLELTEDDHQQVIGIRFQNLNIPKNATITNAYIQFSVDETSSEATNLNIYGEATDNANSFSDSHYNISSRSKTTSSTAWSPPAWNSRHEQGVNQRTPELKDIIQEIVNRGGWSSGNSMSFIITGTGKRVAESYDGESDEAPRLHIEYMGCPTEDNSTTTAMCYALTDDSNKLYKVAMNPNGGSLPIATTINISTNFNGEGSAYRASNNKFYAFKGNSDDHGPSDLYTIDVDTGSTTKIVDNIIAGAVDGAEFYFNPTLNKEILYIISGEYNSKLYAFDPDSWSLLAGYPKDTHTDLSSLAIDPINGVAYAIDDYNYDHKKPKVYKLNLATGATTHITTLQHLADAEGLAFASDGNLYIEDEGRDDLSGKKLYMVNLQTGALTPSAITNSNGDIEGLSCNGTQIAIDNPTVSIDGNRSVQEGDSGTTDLVFPITLSKPAVEDIVLHYEITDINTTANEDYILDSNLTILIPKDSNSSSIIVKVKGDTDVENDESFSLRLLDATNAIVDGSSVVGTIINDDKETAINPEDCTNAPSDIVDFNNNFVFNKNTNVTGDGSVGTVALYENVATINGADVDLKVKVLSLKGLNTLALPSTKTHSVPKGFKLQKIGDENSVGFFIDQKRGDNKGTEYSTELEFSFVKHGTSTPVSFNFETQVFDIDNFANRTEYVGIKNSDYKFFQTSDPTHIVGTQSGEWSIFKNNFIEDSQNFNKNATVKFVHENKSKFIMKFTHIKNKNTGQYGGKAGFNVVFGSPNNGLPTCKIETPQEPFTCNETLYLSNRTELGTGSGDSGATWLHSFDAIGATYEPIGTGFTSDNGGYNAMGYNVQDNFIYALYRNHLLKIDKNSNVKDLGVVTDLPNTQLYAGEFDRDGFYYVTGTGGADNKMYKIDITQKKVVKTITLSQSVRFWDMSLDTTGEYFYAMLIQKVNGSYKNGKFAKIKISDGTITPIGDSHSDLPSYISLIFSDAQGKIVALSQDGKLYEIMPQSGKVYFTRPFAPLSFYNDGTSCPDANITLPPHPPRLSINNVSKLEGDSGETTFNFTVTADKPFDMMPMSGAMFYYRVVDGDGDEVVPPHGVALSSDHDFKAEQGIGMGMNMFGNGVSVNIPVTVYGDEKIEKDEEFYVEIYSPQLPPRMSPKYIIDKNIGIGTIINDDIDLDQDNDGILDSVEYGSCSEGIQKLMSFDDFGTGGRTSTPYTTYCYEDGDGSVECQKAKGIQYWEGNVNVNDGEYAIVQHPNPDASVFSTWSTQGDHTGNSDGRMMVVNASLQPDEFYRRTYSVVPNANMTVDLWILNVVKHGSNIILPNISFHLEDMNGNQIGSTVNTGDIPENSDWNHYTLSLNPQNNSEIQVVLANNALGGSGNDLALDDIRVRQTFCDHDSDGVADYLDLDSDNDGIPDNIEAQTTQGYIVPNGVEDNRGIDTAYPTGLAPIDTDGDNIPDFIDTDSDNDGMLDIDESGLDNHSGSVGDNGLYDTLEITDDYNNTQGMAYDKNEAVFKLIDSDNDTLYNGSNASPMGVDFDYRDNNDSKALFTISNISKKEGDSGPTLFNFKVSVNRTTGHGISFDYQTANGDSSNALENAISGSDYNGRNGHIDIEQNVTSKTIIVSVMGDTYLEDDENFLLEAFNIDGADKNSTTAIGTIINDDDTDIDNNTSSIDLDEDNDGIFDDIEIGDGQNLIANVENNFTKVISTQKDKLYRFTFKLDTNSSSAVQGKIKAFTDDNSSIIINNIFYTMDRYDAFFRAKSSRTRVSFKTDTTQDVNLTIVEVVDSDNDGVPDFLDLDSDNDGIPDNIEAQTTQNYIVPNGEEDNRGVDKAYPTGLTPVDTDGDNIPDYIDTDSDGDGLLDSNESGLEPNGEVGKNGLFNNLEISDDYNNTQGMAYDKNNHIFKLKDSDDDTREDGTNATPTRIDFDYRDTNDNTPLVSIDEIVSKAEGDSGEKTFIFKIALTEIPIHLNTMSYRVRSSENNELISSEHDIATDGEDFIAKEGNISISENKFIYEIPVTVKGDKKVEKDEEFIVELTDINFVHRIINGKSIGIILNDDLKIRVERDNSEFNQSKEQRTSFYTQISGRDFNYSIASYNDDENGTYPLQDMTFKVELYNNDSSLTEAVDYIYFNNSRVLVTKDNDLNISKAIRDANFKIYYLKDENGTILHGNYGNEQLYNEKLNNNGNIEFPMGNSSDHFAIRPASYHIEINDKDENNQTVTYATNDTPNTNLNLVAGYNYKLKAQAIIDGNNSIATHYKTISSKELNVTLDFDETGTTSCADINTSKIENYSFSNGELNDTLSHNNVGKYTLHIEDINWTDIDKDENQLGCIVGSSSNKAVNGKYGCNIASDINMTFQPYKFEFTNTNLTNINGNGKDYLYMSDLGLSREMGVKLSSTIKALGKQDTVLSNFTNGCIESNPNLRLKLKFEFEDDRGVWSDSNMTYPKSADGTEDLTPQQVVALNDNNISESNMTMIKDINIKKKDFKDDNNGTMSINILYNMEKLFDKPTNPIKVDFISLDLNSTDLEGKMKGKDNTPVGVGDIDKNRTFYFARVASYLKKFPETNKKSIHTPLYVEIFCKHNRNWCDSTMKLDTIGQNTYKTDSGWYLAKKHNGNIDGGLLSSPISSNNDINISISTLDFVDGKIEDVLTSYTGAKLESLVKAEIAIPSDAWLRFNSKETVAGISGYPSSYFVTFKPVSGMAGINTKKGIGLGHNLMRSSKGNLNGIVEKNGKLSW